jgi:phage-related baseplate assembly protein
MATNTIDLSALPAPSVIETLDYEASLAEMKARFIALAPQFAAVLDLESEPIVKLLEVATYFRLIDRARYNDGARACFLATATGADLENLGAFYGVSRLTLTPANPFAVPPVEAVFETDADLRRRIQLAPAGLSVAGPRDAYAYHARTAHPDVIDAAVTSPSPAVVTVYILSRQGDGTPSNAMLNAVGAALNSDTIRPLTDQVNVAAPTFIDVAITASLHLQTGPSPAPVLSAVNSALESYLMAQRRLGGDVTVSGLMAALHQPGVHRVALASPAADVLVGPQEAVRVTTRTITLAGVDD